MSFSIADARQIPWTINGRFATRQITGVQRYATEITKQIDVLLKQDDHISSQLAFDLMTPPSAQVSFPLSEVAVKATSLGNGFVWEQLVLPLCASGGILSLANVGPALARRHIVCIHDANTFITPNSYSFAFRTAYRFLLPLIAGTARRVATVSQYSADMLVKYSVATQDKIFIAPCGHEHALGWNASEASSPVLAELVRPYVLLIGSKAKHKNVSVVLQCAAALDELGLDLVVVGDKSGVFADTKEIVGPNIRYTGYVSDHDLAALYLRALCFAFPSLTEGFGLPALEAMALGCPVVMSDAASLPEVGGDAVLYASPVRPADWLNAIAELWRRPELRQHLRESGLERAAFFSWRKSAARFLNEILTLDQSNN